MAPFLLRIRRVNMLNVPINYEEFRDVLLNHFQVERVHFPFKSYLIDQYKTEIEEKGSLLYMGWKYFLSDVNRLQTEEIGILTDISTCVGTNEGYQMIFRFDSGQVVIVKYFEESTFFDVINFLRKISTTKR